MRNTKSLAMTIIAGALAASLGVPASAAVTYKFTQNVGTGDTLYGAFTSAGLGLETTTRPVTFDFTVANALAADTGYDFGFSGLDFHGVPARFSGNVLDFNFSDGTPISSFSLAEFTAAHPGSNPGYYGRIQLGTDSSGRISRYSVTLSAISAYTGPLTADFTAPTNIQFQADSPTSLAPVPSIEISVQNSSRRGTPDFGGLICSSIAQNCGGSFSSGQTGATAGVPEPGSWALLLFGFGGVGHAMRRRKVAARFRFA